MSEDEKWEFKLDDNFPYKERYLKPWKPAMLKAMKEMSVEQSFFVPDTVSRANIAKTAVEADIHVSIRSTMEGNVGGHRVIRIEKPVNYRETKVRPSREKNPGEES